MGSPRLQISESLRQAFSYAKFKGERPRILVLNGEYWLDRSCERAAQTLGWEVYSVPLIMRGCMPREMIGQYLQAVVDFRPDFILSINLTGMDEDGLFARLFEDLRIPFVVWFVDDPRTIISSFDIGVGEYAIALTWERAYAAFLERIGFGEVHYLPLAADTALFDAEPAEETLLPPGFVGTSMLYVADEEYAWLNENSPALAERLLALFDSGCVTRQRFCEGLPVVLGEETVRTLTPDERRHAEIFLFVEGTRRARKSLVETLLPEGLVVYGGADWKHMVPDARPAVGYGEEIARVYSQSEVNVNTTSLQMASAVNQRVFDCPASGGFLLTDAQDDLPTLFEPGIEAVIYQSLDECRDLLRSYRRLPSERREIVRRARRRILSEHTYVHRLEAIKAILTKRFA